MNNTPSKRSVANKLRLAARLLDEYGWIKGDLGDKSIGFCAIGALDFVSNYQMEAERAVRQFLPVYMRLAYWNDNVAKDKTEVQRLFRKVARHLEHGGSWTT